MIVNSRKLFSRYATRCSVTCPVQQDPTDPAELKAFSDAFFAEEMEELHILGVAFVMVKDGMSFPQYVDENIFQPLGMIHSTFRQPVPKLLASDLAVGYWYRGNAYEAAPFICSHA